MKILKIFVSNLFMKFLLLSMMVTPLALSALYEFKHFAQFDSVDSTEPKPAPAVNQSSQEKQGQVFTIPADLRRELMYPSGAAFCLQRPKKPMLSSAYI